MIITKTKWLVLICPLLAGFEAPGDNQGILLKASYWRWPDRDLAGNAIDFYVKVLGASFSDAMKELTKP